MSRSSEAGPIGRLAALRQRTRITTTVSAVLLVGLIIGAAAPSVISFVVLLPSELSKPTGWYRLLTYSLVQTSLSHWLLVAGISIVSGWLAERWLGARAMWITGVLGAVVGGTLYWLLAPPYQSFIGGGFVAAGFAGAAVAATALRRRAVSRRAHFVGLILLLMYGLAPLQPDAQSLAMLGAFVTSGLYAAWRIRAYRIEATKYNAAA